MNNNIFELKKLWSTSDTNLYATECEISAFEMQNGLHIPDDLSLFFKTINGTHGEYNDSFFQFYSLSEFKSITNEFGDWKASVPDYSKLIPKFINSETCFVFANYQFFMFTYCIQLYKNDSNLNEIYILCGDQYKIITCSFTEFIDLYIRDSEKLLW